jgi:PAS domain S-box-containing protein
MTDNVHRDSWWDVARLDPRLRMFLVACVAAALAYAAARIGGTLEILPEGDWPLWPANVLVVSALLAVPRKTWPILMGAAFAAFVVYNLQSRMPIRSICWLTLSDAVEILIAAWGLSYFFEGVPQLNSPKALAKYSVFAGILAPAAGAVFGALSTSGNYLTSWRISFFSEAIAYFTIMPAILGWIGQAKGRVRAPRVYYLEAIVLMAAILSLGYFAFVSRWASTQPFLLYFLVPFLVWSALRFGSAGAGTSAAIVAFLSVWGAAHGRGPFTEKAPIDDILWLQLFLLSTAVPFMVLAALVEEHQRDEKILRESEKRFRLVADTAPVMIWMSGVDKKCNFFNKGWLDFTGRPIEEELGDGWISGVHPEDVQRCVGMYSASFDARVDFEMEYRLRRYDGEYRWVVDYAIPRFDTDSNFCGYIGSCVDITERKSAAESLQILTGRLIHAQDEERLRIARELHDDFSQRLAILGISLGHLSKSLPKSNVEDRAGVEEMLEQIKELASDLHTLSHQLHSSRLEHVGLASALSGLCREVSEKYKLKIEFSGTDVRRTIAKDVALCLFRVAQEALGNVVKHSQARSADVELGASPDGLSLRIHDDGRGFQTDTTKLNTGIGLIGMHERIRLVGGRLLIRSEPMRGTQILAEVPLHVAANATEARAPDSGKVTRS